MIYLFKNNPREGLLKLIEEGKSILAQYKKESTLTGPLEDSYNNWKARTDALFKDLGNDEETKNWFQNFLPGSPNIFDLIETRIFFLESVLIILDQILGNLHQEEAYKDLYVSNSQY